MTTQELLAQYRSLGIRISPEGERLRVQAPNGALTPEIRQQLAARKAEILEFLSSAAAASALKTQPKTPPLVRVPRDGATPLPLSFAQQRLWLIDRLEPGTAAYNLPLGLALRGTLVVPALLATMNEIVRRHEVLRTTFPSAAGEPRQAIAPPGAVHVPLVDLSGLRGAQAAMERERDRLVDEEARQPFDLVRGPLLRVLLLRLAPEDHVATLNMHHIIGDAWSFGVLVREIAALYPAFLAGRPSPLPELPIQFADFSVWQRACLQGEALEVEVAYWRERLRGAPPVLEMPTDRPRKAPQSPRGARRSVALPPEMSVAVAALARREGATLFMMLLAGFQALLLRWTGQADLSVGTPVAGRDRMETEGLIGFFINTLVLRSDLSGDPPFRELLGRVRDTALQAFRHQELPFEKLIEEIRPERSLSHTPLFQVMLAFGNTPQPQLDLPHLTLRQIDMEPAAAKFDLMLELTESSWGLAGTVSYRTELFDATTAERLAGGFLRLMEGTVREPVARLAELPWLSPAELHQVLREWNDTEGDTPAEPTLHGLFERQAARTPEAVAMESDETAITYAELNARASRLAAHLRGMGVAPESLVAICAERSVEMVVGLLGILKAGCAYVPLDPDLPRERLAFVLGDAGAPVLLTQSRLADRLPPHRIPTLFLERDFPESAARDGSPPAPPPLLDHLAYVIYTSGSTGKPKGAMNTHRAVINRLLWMQSAYGLSAADAVLQKTPFGFDVSVWEFFWPLATGARLVMALPGEHQDPEALATRIERAGITTLHFVPSMLAAFLEARRLERCRSVRRVIASGEVLPADLAARFFTRMPWAELHNLYGPTEAAIDVTAWRCEPGPARNAVPIGRPITNLRITLRDAALAPVPPGVPGELYIGGIGLARGYVRRPDLTAERFLPDPDARGGRMYRTGDLARFRPDGAIEFLGRVDHQVKIRGFRIELGEIEEALSAHPAVREAVVLAREETPGDPRLVAYAVPREGALPPAEDLAAFLAVTLPSYMVPSAFVPLPALPLNPNGKVDRRALPSPSKVDLPARAPETAASPRTPVEEVLCAIWADVLHVPRAGIHDSFFTLGGHSLLATLALSRIYDAFGVELALRSLFEAPTPAGMARAIEQARGRDPQPPLVRSDRRGPQPLSFSQLRFWTRRHDLGAANVPLGVRFSGALDPAALERSLRAILRRHEVLRARFQEIDGEPVQVVRAWNDQILDLPLVDLSALPEDLREEEVRRLGAALGGYPFDIARDLLLKAVLIRLDRESQEHALFVVLHHIVTDGWSEGILTSELAALYRAEVRREPSPLPELPIQYADFAAWQRETLRGPVFDDLLGFWLERLHGVETLAIPTDRPCPAVRSLRGGMSHRRLGAELGRGVRELSGRESASFFMTMLAAWKVLLSRWTGQSDVALTTNVANRSRGEIEGLIGVFTNVLALRTDLSGDPSFRELLGRVRTTTLDAFAHQDLPFTEILSRLHPGQGHNEVFPVGFLVQNFPARPLDLSDLTLQKIAIPSATAPRDLILYAGEADEEIHLNLVYRQDSFDEATVAGLLAWLEEILRAAVQSPDLPLSQLAGAAE